MSIFFQNAMEEALPLSWNDETQFATWNNRLNYYQTTSYEPEILDYIFYRSTYSHSQFTKCWMPFLNYSLSDHEGVACQLRL